MSTHFTLVFALLRPPVFASPAVISRSPLRRLPTAIALSGIFFVTADPG